MKQTIAPIVDSPQYLTEFALNAEREHWRNWMNMGRLYMIKERPILMSGPMVQAILREWKNPGTGKRQTRRIMKVQPLHDRCKLALLVSTTGNKRDEGKNEWVDGVKSASKYFSCPYGKPGDRLWVKETFTELIAVSPATDEPLEIGSGERVIEKPTYHFHKGRKIWHYDGLVIAYRANSSIKFCDGDGFMGEFANKQDMPRWKPSIFMPRKYVRIELEIINIRIERLQDISEDDALEEGVLFNEDHSLYWDYEREQWICVDAIDSYQTLINKINGRGTWDNNPFVWVVEFNVIEVKGAGNES